MSRVSNPKRRRILRERALVVAQVTAKITGLRYTVKQIRDRFHVLDAETGKLEGFYFEQANAQYDADCLNDPSPF